MGKRKRESSSQKIAANGNEAYDTQDKAELPIEDEEKGRKVQHTHSDGSPGPVTVQIIVGTYEKVLHGLTATITPSAGEGTDHSTVVEFADTFMFNAHDSAIRCLAASPVKADSEKIVLATGGSDQVVNLYSLSTKPPAGLDQEGPPIPNLMGHKIKENPRNRELGSLQHHGGSVNALYFPTKSKLLSAAEDNTIAVTRTRDWTVLSTIKAPTPKAHGRPSGDTAPLSGLVAGVNDFAVHPSMKLMLSVGKGEKCMRLWNLVTGKRAAVLNFDRDLLQGVGEGKYSSGEGRKVRWNNLGEEFAVAFETGCAVYGVDSKPRCRIVPSPRTKIHQMRYIATLPDFDDLLVLSTEDGRIILYSTKQFGGHPVSASDAPRPVPICEPMAQMGGTTEGLAGRVKDFDIVSLPSIRSWLIVSGSSDGAIRLWQLDTNEFTSLIGKASQDVANTNWDNSNAIDVKEKVLTPRKVGKLLSTYEAGSRIMCLTIYVMSGMRGATDI